jgi:hypothetical protein
VTFFIVLFWYSCGGTKENHEKSQGNQLHGRDSYFVPSEFISCFKEVKVMQRRQGTRIYLKMIFFAVFEVYLRLSGYRLVFRTKMAAAVCADTLE